MTSVTVQNDPQHGNVTTPWVAPDLAGMVRCDDFAKLVEFGGVDSDSLARRRDHPSADASRIYHHGERWHFGVHELAQPRQAKRTAMAMVVGVVGDPAEVALPLAGPVAAI